MDYVQDYIMKMMEDIVGKIFRGNRFIVFFCRKKLQYIYDKFFLRVIYKKVLKKNLFNNVVKFYCMKVKEGKLVQFKKYYLKFKVKGKVKMSKGKYYWIGKNSDLSMDIFKGKYVGGILNKYVMFKKFYVRKMFNENQGKFKNILVIEDGREKGKKFCKVVS